VGGLLALLAAAGCAQTQAVRPQAGAASAPSKFDLPACNFAYVGMDAEMLVRLVGRPAEVAPAPRGEVWYYEFGAVIVRDGRLIFKYPPSALSKAGAEPPPGG